MLRLLGGLEGLFAATISSFALFWLGIAAGIWLIGYAPTGWPNLELRSPIPLTHWIHFTIRLPSPVGDGTALTDLRAKEAAAGKRAVVVETRYVQVGQAVGAQLAQSQAKAARVNRGLHTYINQVLGDQHGPAFSLTRGWVYVYNASASGAELPAAANTAAGADDAPAGISSAASSAIVADNNAQCLDWRDREAAWRAWWAGVSAAAK